MKFLYEYRTSDNVRHQGVVTASNREAAFAALKQKGIRPGSLSEAPGFFNKLFGKGKRWLAIATLGMLVVAAAVIIRSNKHTIQTIEQSRVSPLPRHQVYGDPALMAAFERAHFRNLMPTEADAYLAHYAQPGVLPELGTNDAAVVASFERLVASGFEPALELTDADLACREASELKRIVMAMRDEMRLYLSDGIGTPASYLKRLNDRLRREQRLYRMAQSDLERTEDDGQWEKINDSLRAVGLPTVPRSDDRVEKNSEKK